MTIRTAGIGALLLAGLLPRPAEAARHVIEIRNMAFAAPPAHLKAGDTIHWENKDIFRHTATARSGSFDLDLPPGKGADVTLKKPGELTVFCRYHPNMTVKLVVEK
jgi:plastocyanin